MNRLNEKSRHTIRLRPVPPLPHPSWQARDMLPPDRRTVTPDQFWQQLGL